MCRLSQNLFTIVLLTSIASVAAAATPRLAFVYGDRALVSDEVIHDGAALVTRNGRFVYATRAEQYGLMERTRNPATGEVMGRYTGADAADWWPTAMALSRDDQRLYVVGNWPSAILIGFLEPSGNGMTSSRVLPRQFMLSPGSAPPAEPLDPICSVQGLRQPRGIALSPDDRHLYVTSIADDSLVVLRPEFWRISKLPTAPWDGSVRPVQLFQDDEVREPEPDADAMTPRPLDGAPRVDGLRTPRGVVVSRDGRDVYVAGSGEDAIATFRRDAESGRLQFTTAVKEPASSPGYGLKSPVHLVISPDDRHLYVACGGDTVMVFVRSAETGRLKYIQTLWNGRDGIVLPSFPVCQSPSARRGTQAGRNCAA
jgi:DNA-binding beta-propeller fold protein YncE